MSVIAAGTNVGKDAGLQANGWVERNLRELKSRGSAVLGRVDENRREEEIAEIVAMSVVAAHSAAKRGVLHRLTPFWCVIFAAKQLRSGRSCAGMSTRCVHSKGTQVRGRAKVVSLESMWRRGRAGFDLGEAISDRRSENPFDVVRREMDYRAVFDKERVGGKARAVFRFLAETHGEGRQADLAAELGVSPGRVSQLKRQLAQALQRNDYCGPLGPRPSRPLASSDR